MIVTAGAAERQAEKDLGRGGDDIVELIVAILGGVGGLVVPGTETMEARGDDRVGAGLGQLVAGDLLDKEAVVGFIVVERADDPVAIAPGVGLGRVALESVGLGEPYDVEPVPRPSLAMCGAGE